MVDRVGGDFFAGAGFGPRRGEAERGGVAVDGGDRPEEDEIVQIGVFNQSAADGAFQLGVLNHNENGFLHWFPFINF